MKTYEITYEIKGKGYVAIVAKSEEEAIDEFNSLVCHEPPLHEENEWIDEDALYDIEHDIDILEIDEGDEE